MCYGFTPPAIFWIKSYLSDRTHRVFFNGSISNIIQVESGIPQGSCLGLLLFSIFADDLPLAPSKASVCMYYVYQGLNTIHVSYYSEWNYSHT